MSRFNVMPRGLRWHLWYRRQLQRLHIMRPPHIVREGANPDFATETTADHHWRGHPMRFTQRRWTLILTRKRSIALTTWKDNRLHGDQR